MSIINIYLEAIYENLQLSASVLSEVHYNNKQGMGFYLSLYHYFSEFLYF
jgi:hypothetical protein